jgi:hypothetical protein
LACWRANDPKKAAGGWRARGLGPKTTLRMMKQQATQLCQQNRMKKAKRAGKTKQG